MNATYIAIPEGIGSGTPYRAALELQNQTLSGPAVPMESDIQAFAARIIADLGTDTAVLQAITAYRTWAYRQYAATNIPPRPTAPGTERFIYRADLIPFLGGSGWYDPSVLGPQVAPAGASTKIDPSLAGKTILG